MLFVNLLVILATASSTIGRPVSSGPFVGETSFEFRSNRTFPFNARIRELLNNAQDKHSFLSMEQYCSHPVSFKFGKCDEAFFRHEKEHGNVTLVFDEQGVNFLMDAVNKDCSGSWYPDGAIHFKVTPMQMTQCKFVFKLTKKEQITNEFALVETPAKQFYYYQKVQKVLHMKIQEKESDLLFHMLMFLATICIFGFSVTIGMCLTSDGLGDDEIEATGAIKEEQDVGDQVEERTTEEN